jgi:hypothetical protein
MTGIEIAAVATAASAAIGAVGAIQQGNAQAAAANYNAQLQEREARQRSREANLAEEAQRRRSRQQLGRQRAQLAESGIGFGEMGQSLIADSAKFAELDALNIRYEGETMRRGLLAGAGLSRFDGKNARRSSRFTAAGTLLSGAGRTYNILNPAGGRSNG